MFFSVVNKLGLDFTKDEIALVPQFNDLLKDKELGMKAFHFIVACYHYLSPYQNLGEEERIKKCAEDIFKQKGKVHALDSQKVKVAIDKFNELQFDSDWENYFALEKQCRDISKFLNETEFTAETMEYLEKSGRTLKVLSEMKNELKEIIFAKVQKPEENLRMRARKKLSFAEEKFLPETK